MGRGSPGLLFFLLSPLHRQGVSHGGYRVTPSVGGEREGHVALRMTGLEHFHEMVECNGTGDGVGETPPSSGH